MDRLLGMRCFEDYSYKSGSAFKGHDFNNSWRHWSPPRRNNEDWCQRDAYSYATPRTLLKDPESYSVSSLCEVPSESDGDDEDSQDSSQNSSCQCSECCDSDLDSQEICRNKNLNRGGDNLCGQCGESCSDTDSSVSSDLHQIFDKMFRVAKWGGERRPSAGLQTGYGEEENSEGPEVLFLQRAPPHTRDLVRVKSFKRHQMYERLWKAQPAIGENFRFSLRQKVRQKMLRKEEAQLPHKVFVPNLYVVPTVKPRYNLRWAVRKCNHDYRMPPVGFYHDL